MGDPGDPPALRPEDRPVPDHYEPGPNDEIEDMADFLDRMEEGLAEPATEGWACGVLRPEAPNDR